METLKPQPGIYRHYKKGNEYRVIGAGKVGRSIGTDGLLDIAHYSEDPKIEVYVFKRGKDFVLEGNLPSDLEFVIYEQHYDSDLFKKGSSWVRPLEMFLETVKVDGKEVPRFTYIGKDNGQGTG